MWRHLQKSLPIIIDFRRITLCVADPIHLIVNKFLKSLKSFIHPTDNNNNNRFFLILSKELRCNFISSMSFLSPIHCADFSFRIICRTWLIMLCTLFWYAMFMSSCKLIFLGQMLMISLLYHLPSTPDLSKLSCTNCAIYWVYDLLGFKKSIEIYKHLMYLGHSISSGNESIFLLSYSLTKWFFVNIIL